MPTNMNKSILVLKEPVEKMIENRIKKESEAATKKVVSEKLEIQNKVKITEEQIKQSKQKVKTLTEKYNDLVHRYNDKVSESKSYKNKAIFLDVISENNLSEKQRLNLMEQFESKFDTTNSVEFKKLLEKEVSDIERYMPVVAEKKALVTREKTSPVPTMGGTYGEFDLVDMNEGSPMNEENTQMLNSVTEIMKGMGY